MNPLLKTRFMVVTLCAVVAALCVAAVRSIRAEQDNAPQHPLIVMWSTSFRTSQNDHCSNGGLKIAIWKDGTVLFSPLPHNLGEAMLIGQLDQKELSELLETFKKSGLFTQSRSGYAVPDSASTTIKVEGLGTRFWHEYIMPGFGGNIDEDKEYYQFVKAWRKCTSALEGLVPIHLRRLDENVQEPKAMFRGYNSAEWFMTPWLR